MTAEVAVMIEQQKYAPMLEEIAAAFAAVFGGEVLQGVQQTLGDGREIFTIFSDKQNRTYLRTPGQPFEELFRSLKPIPEVPEVPEVPEDKKSKNRRE